MDHPVTRHSRRRPQKRLNQDPSAPPRRRFAVALLALLLGCLSTTAGTATARATNDDSYLHPVTAVIWPAPADGGQNLTAVVDIKSAGEYDFRILQETNAAVVTSSSLGHLEPGRYTWEWDGRRRNGELATPGRHILEFYGTTDAGTQYFDVEETRSFTVRYSTETVTVIDLQRESTSTHVDVSTFSLSNGPRRVDLTYRFARLRATALTGLSAGLDVNRLQRGYLVGAHRTPRGWKTTVSLAVLGSDIGTPERVRCPGARTQLQGRIATTTIPRNCFRRGGSSMRAYWSVTDRHYHGDYLEYPAEYWTPWATYAVPRASSS